MDNGDPADWALSHGERLLIRTLRRLALRIACHGLKGHFELACGIAGHEAYRAMAGFVEQLRATGRRRIDILAPPATGLTADERLILAAFTAAQADDYQEMDLLLMELTAAIPPPVVGETICLVAQVFALQGLTLAVSGEHDPDQHRRPVRRCGGDHVAVPDRAGELQALVHIEDHAG